MSAVIVHGELMDEVPHPQTTEHPLDFLAPDFQFNMCSLLSPSPFPKPSINILQFSIRKMKFIST